MTKSKIQMTNTKTKVLSFGICALTLFCYLCFVICHLTFAQEEEIEFTLDVKSPTVTLPKIFQPNIDLSGQGPATEAWPKNLAEEKILELWEKEIGLGGIYRLQYNLWEINELAKDKALQEKLLSNYEKIIQKITASGGVVILNLFGTPAGLGKLRDKRSAPLNLKAFKELVKSHIRNLSCLKRYNIWYEVWNAVDLDAFFLGRKQDYLNLYRIVAEAIKELRQETKIYIPVGGPSVSWWFQNCDGNTIITAQKSLIYELIRFCFRYRLPLDFISWHSYTTDPQIEKEMTIYKKTAVKLIRDWLSYFHFDQNIPLIVDEWNYDRGINLIPERDEKSHLCASYIFSRLNKMYEAGLDYQLYFSLQDFQNPKEGIIRNVGVFSILEKAASEEKYQPKVIYNAFKMLTNLGNNLFSAKINDEFVGVLPTQGKDYIAIVIYNYIDPEIAKNYLSRNISSFSSSSRKTLIRLAKTGWLDKIIQGKEDISSLGLDKKLKSALVYAQKLNELAIKFSKSSRSLKLKIKNISGDYLYQRYKIDYTCNLNCEFKPAEEKEIAVSEFYEEKIILEPYSVNMIILKPKPKEIEVPVSIPSEEIKEQNLNNTTP